MAYYIETRLKRDSGHKSLVTTVPPNLPAKVRGYRCHIIITIEATSFKTCKGMVHFLFACDIMIWYSNRICYTSTQSKPELYFFLIFDLFVKIIINMHQFK